MNALAADSTRYYNERIVEDKDLVVTREAILAHRKTSGAGSVLKSAFQTWQRPEAINQRCQRACEVQPIDPRFDATLSELWQIRHVLAHLSGVTSEVDG